MTLLIDYARDVLGLPMRGLMHGTHLGWTTDPAKSEALVAAGGRSSAVTALSGRIVGFEVGVGVGAEMAESVAA